MTGRVRRKSWLLLAAMLAIASAIVLVWLQSTEVISSLVRDPLFDFVQPAIAVWWFVLGGPFRTAPSSAGGIAFAAVANAFFWLLLLWFVARLLGAIRRRLVASRP